MTYVLQDLKCKKYREVRQRFVMEGWGGIVRWGDEGGEEGDKSDPWPTCCKI